MSSDQEATTGDGHTSRFPLLSIRGLEKSFFATRAARDVSFEVGAGEIVALLGENGAGKSTVIKMLAGAYKPDAGEIRLNGRELAGGDTRASMSFIHQNLGLVEWMTVAENIAQLVGYPRRFGLIDYRAMRRRAEEILALVGGEIDPDSRVMTLPRTERSLLAIARSLVTEPELLVLDEPTASLPAQDVERLFDVLRQLRDSGVGMIYVSHRLDEVYEIASRAVVMRNGAVVADRPVDSLPHAELVELICGTSAHDPVFEAPKDRERVRIDQLVLEQMEAIDLTVRAGEIVALCGLRGAGQEKIGRCLAGALPPRSGRVMVDGDAADLRTCRGAIASGIGFSTSNRESEAVAAGLTVRENLFLNPGLWGRPSWRPCTRNAEARLATEVLAPFGVRPADPELSLDTFSGGNQQKVILARWIGLGRKVLVLEEPTMGVDVGAKADIYVLLAEAASTSTAVVLISTDMEEVAKVAHRAVVFGRGRVVAEIERPQLSIGNLVAAASDLDTTTAARSNS